MDMAKEAHLRQEHIMKKLWTKKIEHFNYDDIYAD
jgi:hypothetical protein